ncbi:GH36-type glycosyl hydrolase domain-containing protein [Cerasicoccus frondis]|uniref:GH36-type glycosyl hydrolase domain-containing protein n=1 Tax=Cerasicoccus frondis TaxID=490090 RepID=UPI002852ADAB|nr:hypothetical protein [Cerasicoccus frondis]
MNNQKDKTSNTLLNKAIKEISVEKWGYFNIPDKEFILTTPCSPKPWKNILWNQHFNAQPTQVSAGICYTRKTSGENILVNWSGVRHFYLYNRKTGQCFNPGYFPICHADYQDFSCRFGLGYLTTRINCLGLIVEVTHMVDPELRQEYFKLDIITENTDDSDWDVIFYSELDLRQNDGIFSNNPHFVANTAADQRQATLVNRSTSTDEYTVTLGSSIAFSQICFERNDFIGAYGSLAQPVALEKTWDKPSTAIDTPIFAAKWPIANCSRQPLIICLSNEPGSIQTSVLNTEHFHALLATQKKRFADAYAKPCMETPDATFDLYANTWIKHQLNYCAHWNRGWGKGFRDNAQDAWAYCQLAPEHARRMLTDCLPFQYADGSTVRRWAPVVKHRYNDGGVWLVLATHAYLAETGDVSLLNETAPFFESSENGTTYEHLQRGLNYLWEQRGSNGLCLMPFGDWNDRLTGVGKDGRGESVWTTMALAEGLRRLAQIAEFTNRNADAKTYRARREIIIEKLQTAAWNGEWFSRAFKDDGTPLGAPENEEAFIFLLPQAWSILAGIATDEQQRTVTQATKQHLDTVHGFRLLYPPFTRYDETVGHLSAVPPGRLENGGNYCHGSFFMIYALCESGELDYALEMFNRVLPINPLNPPSHSRQEPFSLTNSYASPESGDHAGRAQFPWRTGSAGWALRTATEGILGVRATLDGLMIRGEIPSSWKEASLIREYRGFTLNITWQRTGNPSRELNGIPCSDDPITESLLRPGDNDYAITL